MSAVSRPLACLAAVALLALPGRARGQERVGSRSSIDTAAAPSNCDSVLRAARVDSTRVAVRAYLLRTDGGALSTRRRALLLQDIAGRLELPQPLALPLFAAGPARLRMLVPAGEGDATARRPVLHGIYRVLLGPWPQRVDSVRTLVTTLAPQADSAILAVLAAVAAEPNRRVGDGDDGKPMPLQLYITSGVVDPRVRSQGITLFEAYFPVVRMVDAVPSPDNLPPPYPPSAIDGDDGEVLLQVVVGTDGAPVPGTVEALHATSEEFLRAAVAGLARYRFTPARVDGCAVPQEVEVPFWFSLRP